MIATFSPLPPAKGVPSIEPSKSTVTLSPLAAARVTAVYFICCLRSRSIIASMSLSVTSARDALDLERVERPQSDLRKNLERRHIGQVLTLGNALRLDARAAGRRELILGDRLGEARLQQLADHFAMHLLAELLTDHRERSLAGPKAFQARRAAQLLQPRRQSPC